jgi:hypothetical protein
VSNERKNGKAWKKKPKVQKKTGKTIDGYSPAKLAIACTETEQVMYLDTGTMIGIMIALVASMLTIGYSIYIIKTQNEIIQRMSNATATRRKMER